MFVLKGLADKEMFGSDVTLGGDIELAFEVNALRLRCKQEIFCEKLLQKG